MSDSVQIIINDTRARAILTGIAQAGSSDGVRQVIGRSATNLIQKHLRELNQSRPNRLGGKRSNFYSKAAASTHYKPTADGAQVAVTETGFALRYYGGTVRPVNAKALAIPARPEMYGYRPRERPEEMFVIWKPGKAVGLLATRAGSALRILYFLVHKATIRADKTLLPEHTAIQEAVSRSVESYIRRTAAREQQGAE
jgi:hypothetical protein